MKINNNIKHVAGAVETWVITPLVKLFNKNKHKGETENPREIIRQGMIVIILFFGGLLVWGVLGHISGAVVGQGKVKLETERKTVQHLEGGIVDSILVQEGDEVEEGQPLIILESVQVDATANMWQKQLVGQKAALLRNIAEKMLQDKLVWPDDLIQKAKAADCMDILSTEEKFFAARVNALAGQISLLESQISQIDAQIAGSEDQIRAETKIISTLQEELKAKRQLFNERYLEKSQILELERNLASHEGNRGSRKQAVAEAKQRRVELALRIEDTKNRFVEEASNGSSKLQNEVSQLEEKLRSTLDVKNRLKVLAPVAGRVVDLKVHSRGGVIRAGEPLMDIVPQDKPLVVETHVPVNKITEVFLGQEANVQLDAFDARLIPHIPGKVTYISADRLEERTNAGMLPYYLCYVEVDGKKLHEENVYLSPGMPVTVYITTKKRSILYFIFEPLIKNWDRALRE